MRTLEAGAFASYSKIMGETDTQDPAAELAAIEKELESANATAAAQAKSDGEAAVPRWKIWKRFPLRTPRFLQSEKANKYSGVFSGFFLQMFQALFTTADVATRRVAVLFFLSLIGVSVTLTMAYQRYVHLQDLKSYEGAGLQATSKNLSEFIQKQSDQAKHKYSTLSLGKFQVSVELPPGVEPRRGVANTAEFELIVQCDNKETRYFIEDHLAEVRDQLTAALVRLQRDDLMTRDGKKRLKQKMIDQLNAWLPQGKVEDLFFDDLIAS